MGYVDYEYFKSIYGDSMPETDFNRLSWESCRRIDVLTTGKLKFAFPTNEDDAEAVKRCVCELIDFMYQVNQYSKMAMQSVGVIQKNDGTVVGKVITSMSSGSESIGYSVSGSFDKTDVMKSAESREYRDNTMTRIVKALLAFVGDANGVNLLFAGPYPGKREVWK